MVNLCPCPYQIAEAVSTLPCHFSSKRFLQLEPLRAPNLFPLLRHGPGHLGISAVVPLDHTFPPWCSID